MLTIPPLKLRPSPVLRASWAAAADVTPVRHKHTSGLYSGIDCGKLFPALSCNYSQANKDDGLRFYAVGSRYRSSFGTHLTLFNS